MNALYNPDEKKRLLAIWSKEGGLSGNALKFFACLFMFFDHMAQGGVLRDSLGIEVGGLLPFQYYDSPGLLAGNLMVLFGRIAFPIFCFFLVQGLFLTRDYKKQLIRLFLFGVLSEIPFDVVANGGLEWGHQNVYFTLVAGAALVVLLERIRHTDWKRLPKIVASTAVFLAIAALSAVCGFDYGAFGIGAILLYYLAREDRFRTLSATLFGFWFEAPLFGTVYLSLPFLWLYNGKRGRGHKYAFYAFYPLHLLFLYLLSLIF